MVKVNELRIGNWVEAIGNFGSYPSGKIQVTEIFDDGIERSLGDSTIYKEDELNGIRIIPEILEKCGFKKLNRVFLTGSLDEIGWRRAWSLLELAEGWIIMDDRDMRIGYSFKYLHQLQNLYFALTGEELNYQPYCLADSDEYPDGLKIDYQDGSHTVLRPPHR